MDRKIEKKLENFFTKYKHQNYKKGEILIRADESPSGVFYLKQGAVKEYTISRKGDELIVNIFRPISFFPMSWAINNTHNMYYFEAMNDIEVFLAPREEVIAFIKREPDVLYDLMSRVYKGIDGLLTRMVYLMAGNAYVRLVAEIIIFAKRFGRHKSAPPFGAHQTAPPFGAHQSAPPSEEVELKISETDLAAQTGMTRETVSREMKKLKNKKLLVFNKNLLHIDNLQRLEKELGMF